MDIGPLELIIILFIVILVFGPGRLVGLGSELGRGIREFRQGLHTNEIEAKDLNTNQPANLTNSDINKTD